MKLCNVNINCSSVQDIFDIRECKIIVTVNSETIVRFQSEKKLQEIVNSSITTIDGQIPLWLYKLTYPNIKIEKISGSDLIYIISEWAENNNKKIFLLGGKNYSNKIAIQNLKKRYSNLQVDGFSPSYLPYPFPDDVNQNILSKIESFKPDILFVGFGMGKQEFWEWDNINMLKKVGVKIVIGCGGTFEFVSGEIKRAPKFIQNIGLEGFWRLANEFKWFRIKRLFTSFKIFPYYIKFHIFKK